MDLGDELADVLVRGGDPGDVRDLLTALDLGRLCLDLRDDRGDALLVAPLEHHRVGAGGDVPQSFVDDR
ncbi:MAG TPA: hypothetical protein VM070_05330, partial [Candidatus Saccharimonadales bacterium]|nr:hypothetical protein [Candidatus Saccharimonadales bacterium]